MWRFTFSVALIGCDADLENIEPGTIERVKEEFLMPSEWTLIDMVANARKAEFRGRVADKVNRIVGDQLVSDVLIFRVGYEDHNVALDP